MIIFISLLIIFISFQIIHIYHSILSIMGKKKTKNQTYHLAPKDISNYAKNDYWEQRYFSVSHFYTIPIDM